MRNLSQRKRSAAQMPTTAQVETFSDNLLVYSKLQCLNSDEIWREPYLGIPLLKLQYTVMPHYNPHFSKVWRDPYLGIPLLKLQYTVMPHYNPRV